MRSVPTGEEILNTSLQVPEHVVLRAFATETVLLNLQTGIYHGLNETGGRLLELLPESGGSVHGAAQRLAAEYEAPEDAVAGDAAAFFTALLERGLVEPVAPA